MPKRKRGSPASQAATSVAPDEPRVISFTSPQALTKAIDESNLSECDALYVRDVSVSTYERLKKYRCYKRRKYRFRRYYPAEELLIVAINTRTHEQLHINLYLDICLEIRKMGLKRHWASSGAATFTALSGGSEGEADSSGSLFTLGEGHTEWPNLIVEGSHSMSLEEMRRHMAWWFEASDHQVKIVLLVKADGPSTVIIEKWQEPPRPERVGATTTRASSRQNPQSNQVITITRVPGSTNPYFAESYEVTSGGALRLEFQDLFLRPPGPGEHDVIIENYDLQDIATRVARGLRVVRA
ncbi:unnamed protein product [Clonostachys rhizophaga]|uniref:Uncharacterized protein n=1 Tax=Clonostachys rhizophaga TaxID=160324 RepID=A0A9N9UYT1_9HYPO|nr:unnamed protein product [Clonostachys rhizophaga]